jgi:mRNA interferase MazF
VRRGELYRVKRPSTSDPRTFRVFVVVSRQALIDTRYSTVICAPVYSDYEGLSTQAPVGIAEGLKHDSAVHCDGLVSLPKSMLTNYVGMLSPEKLSVLNTALRSSLGLDEG